MTYKTILAIALILFIGAVAIQYLIKDKPQDNKVAYVLNELSEVIVTIATFCFVVSMAWIIALQ